MLPLSDEIQGKRHPKMIAATTFLHQKDRPAAEPIVTVITWWAGFSNQQHGHSVLAQILINNNAAVGKEVYCLQRNLL